MHVLFVALSFPSPEYPYRQPFLREQVRLLCERKDYIKRVTVLSPTTFVPAFMKKWRRVSVQASLPDGYQLVRGSCEVLFPRYLKAPGNLFLRWTTAQWRRIVDRTVTCFAHTDPVSIIHANFGCESSLASISVAKRHHIPCVVTYQGSDVHTVLANRLKGWKLCRDSFRLADLNLMVSRSLESILRLSAQPTGRCELLLRGVDQAVFFPATEPTKKPHVLYVGYIQRAKGVFDLLRAWTRVRLACPGALLTLVGQDRTNGLFSREARSLGVESAIRLTGPVPSSKVADLMRQSMILCLPSHAEGTPNCVMEALSSGLPVLATRVGGIPDIVEHEKTGLLINERDVDGLASALITLLNDPSDCARMGQAAWAYACQHLDARKSVSRLIELYLDSIRNRQKRAPASSL